MTVIVMKSTFQNFKPKVTLYRNFKNFSNDTFGEYMLSKLSMENINTSDNGLEKFLNICVGVLDNFAPRKKSIHEETMPLL